jgi:hypothetical protein
MINPADIDLDQTDRVAELAKIPHDDRDAAWLADFLAAIPTAAFRVPPEEIMKGPDGFPYLLFFLPPADVEFQGFSLRAVLDTCLAKGVGLAIYPEQKDKPIYVFTYGQLWSYKSTGRFDARDADTAAPTMPPPAALGGDPAKRDQAMIGSPNDAYFPPFARGIVREYLKLNGVGIPRVALVADADGRRPQSLLFNLYREDFKNDDHLREVLMRLSWYFPPHYNLRPLVDRGTQVDEYLQPI